MMPWLLLADASWSGPLAGTSPASTTSVGTPPLPPIDASFNLSLLGPLALVSLLLIVALLVLRYVRLAKSPSQAGLLSVVAQAALSPQHTVYLVQAAGRYLLLGGAPGGLALLSEVPANRIADATPQRTVGAPLGTTYPPASDDDDAADSDDDLPALGGPSHRASQAGPQLETQGR